MLRRRPGKRSRNGSPRMRMNPASTMRSGSQRATASPRAVSKSSRSRKCAWLTISVRTACAAAILSPAAPGSLLKTATTCAGKFARNSADMLLPRPEIRMTMRFIALSKDARLRLAARAGADASDSIRGLATRVEQSNRALSIGVGDHCGHADAAVEHAKHLLIGYAARILQPGKERRPRPGSAVDLRHGVLGKDARDIFQQPAAGDVCKALDVQLTHQREQRFHVDTRWGKQRIAQHTPVKIGPEI